jgi:hypothetical protein
MPDGSVRFVLDDGEMLTLAAGDVARVYELCWKLAPKGGAIELAALIRGVTRADMVGAPIDLDMRQSAVMREAVASLQV